MKLRATSKELKKNYTHIISINNEKAQYLLKYREPFAYNTGVAGWNYDAYDIGGVLIVTGYSPFEVKNKTDYSKLKYHEDKARMVATDWELTEEEKKETIDGILDDFIFETLE